MSSSELRAAAAHEVLRRRAARRSLLAFTQYTYGQYRADGVHGLIAGALDRVVDGSVTRLMIFAPPQHGKSELVSVRLPAFWLGKRPDDPVVLASYGADLAESKSRQARDVVASEEYEALFGDLAPSEMAVSVRADSRSVRRWQLEGRRGAMLAVGVGGPITGHGAQLGIIDDPVENWEQAQSQTYRDRAWEWYRGTFRTRIWESGAIVLIMTRWHEDDLAGRLLREQPGQWRVLRLPALAESQEQRDDAARRMGLALGEPDPLGRQVGEALAPRRYSAQALAELRADTGSVVFAAEYQGDPRAPEGNRFKRSWFQIVDGAPAQAERVRYWDMAASTGPQAKRTAGVLLAKAADGVVYVEDVVLGQWTPGPRNQVVRQVAELDVLRYGPGVRVRIEQEPGSSGIDAIEALITLLSGFAVAGDKATGDKDVRLEPFAAQAEAGNVRLVRGAWNGEYIDEMCAVPNGFYRDQADATAGGFNQLRRKTGATVGATVVQRQALVDRFGVG